MNSHVYKAMGPGLVLSLPGGTQLRGLDEIGLEDARHMVNKTGEHLLRTGPIAFSTLPGGFEGLKQGVLSTVLIWGSPLGYTMTPKCPGETS